MNIYLNDTNQSFLPGMYVRVPQDIDREDMNFREFRIGQILEIDHIAYTALIHFDHPNETDSVEVTCAISHLERCLILPQTKFLHLVDNRRGKTLIHCDDQWLPGQFIEYYVLFDGETHTKRLSEEKMRISSIRQNPHPEQQLRRYEFQHPKWKSLRDLVIESYSQLHNATFGIEDLVGSRIMLLAHQAEVIARVLSNPECRYILADEVGLGKTIETCVILKGLYRRFPQIRTLIIAPNSLTQQWRNELNTKFWLDFPILSSDQPLSMHLDGPGYIVNAEDLSENSKIWQEIHKISWGLLIVDEAHHLHKSPSTYACVYSLSAHSERALILSATPVQRRAKEYLKLLALMSPKKYNIEDEDHFSHLIKAQGKIRKKVITIAQNLNPDDFDPEEFEDDIAILVKELKHDQILRSLVTQFSKKTKAPDQGLEAAEEILAYVSENYRIENRVIRNRRAHLTIALPQRQLDASYSYEPTETESTTLEALYEYLGTYTLFFEESPITAEYCRILMHASASSPHALLQLLETRATYLQHHREIPLTKKINLSLMTFTAPRQEPQRIQLLVTTAPSLPEEHQNYLEVLLWRVKQWIEQTEAALEALAKQRGNLQQGYPDRLAQVFLALDQAIRTNQKVVVFSAWHPTLDALLPHLCQKYGQKAIGQFTTELDMNQLQEEVNSFQEQSFCRILLCDELGGEGRNFQIADKIVHIDLPWTPSQLEQRIGRVDRLGREGVVPSIVPFTQNWPEQDLFRIWHEAFDLFRKSISGLEITLEGIQDALHRAILANPRNGLANLVEIMVQEAERLRKSVEDEQYFEELAVNRQKREEFKQISDDYKDGKKLCYPLLDWAELTGLTHEYDETTEILTYKPKEFHIIQMNNAKMFRFPNMEDALRRSGRKYDYVIRGTFNRVKAVQQERLIFFAPSSDPWTDAIIKNAWEADRGRCCAIQRTVSEIDKPWQGIELLYSLSINPRPLYAAGFGPIHLFRALGFLRIGLYRILISEDGKIQSKNSIAWKASTKTRFSNSHDIHLGRREESRKAPAQIQHFKQQYPIEEWNALIDMVIGVAEEKLQEELAFMEDEAQQAKRDFTRHAMGLRASNLWTQQITENNSILAKNTTEIQEYEQISAALVEGISHPLHQLESACFWRLESRR